MIKKQSKTAATTASSKKPTIEVGWTFLTNHAHVLFCLYRGSDLTLREVSELVGITERMVQKIVGELVDAGFIEVTRTGRRNSYRIDKSLALRHPLESHRKIGDLLELLLRKK